MQNTKSSTRSFEGLFKLFSWYYLEKSLMQMGLFYYHKLPGCMLVKIFVKSSSLMLN